MVLSHTFRYTSGAMRRNKNRPRKDIFPCPVEASGNGRTVCEWSSAGLRQPEPYSTRLFSKHQFRFDAQLIKINKKRRVKKCEAEEIFNSIWALAAISFSSLRGELKIQVSSHFKRSSLSCLFVAFPLPLAGRLPINLNANLISTLRGISKRSRKACCAW
jgi:hypothetical protein